MMTTADGMHPAFYGSHPKLFLISDIYRFLPTSHGNCRSLLYPCYVKADGNVVFIDFKVQCNKIYHKRVKPVYLLMFNVPFCPIRYAFVEIGNKNGPC